MIKGVNKQVLEINDRENGFFEKAIFFVKPEYSGFSEGRLRESAKKELSEIGAPPKTNREKRQFALKKLLYAASFSVLGIALGMTMAFLIK